MATIIEPFTILTSGNDVERPYIVVTPTTHVEFDTLQKAREWGPLIATRIVSEEEARAYSINKIKTLKTTNPEFFKN